MQLVLNGTVNTAYITNKMEINKFHRLFLSVFPISMLVISLSFRFRKNCNKNSVKEKFQQNLFRNVNENEK